MDALSILHDLSDRDRARPALVTDSATWTFADLADRVLALAARLRSAGIREGTRVALVAAGTPEVFLAIHTLAAIGATLVPIHPRLSAAEARAVIEIAAADVELDPVTSAVAQLAAPVTPEGVHNAPAPAPFAIVSTSGTTGRPKGAVLSRAAILAAAAASAENLGWDEDDRWLLCMPLAHVGGLSIVTRCLLARRAVVMLPRFEPLPVLAAILRHRVTLLSVVPTMLHALLDAAAASDAALRAPRALLLGGAAAPPALLEACERRGIRALPTYGLTEACSQVTCARPSDLDESPRPAGSGAPLAGFEVRVAASDDAPLPPGEIGRILVRGPALFTGYWVGEDPPPRADVRTPPAPPAPQPLAPPTLTRRFLPHDPAAFFDTGDLGALDPRGRLHVYTRRTDLIVTGGENVYPAEVEQALERCPGVRRALVFAVPDPRWGQIVAAALEIDPASPPQITTLTDSLSTSLAPHKRPRKWALVDQLPLTPSGKVDRKDAAGRFADWLS